MENQVQQRRAMAQELGQKFRAVITQPIVFFNELSLAEPLTGPLTFFGSVLGINTLVSLLFALGAPAKIPQAIMITMALHAGVFFGGVGIMRLVASRLGGKGNYQDLLRACSYAYAPNVVSWIPLVSFFFSLYSLYLTKLAVEKVEGIEGVRANTVVGVMVGTFVLTAIVLALLSLMTLAKKANGGM